MHHNLLLLCNHLIPLAALVMFDKGKLLIGLVLLTSAFFSYGDTDQLSKNRKQTLTHIVKQDCGSCHGMTLKGGLGTPLLPQDLAGKNIDFVTYTILHGRPGTAMPPFKAIFSEPEAKWIAQQLLKGAFNEQ